MRNRSTYINSPIPPRPMQSEISSTRKTIELENHGSNILTEVQQRLTSAPSKKSPQIPIDLKNISRSNINWLSKENQMSYRKMMTERGRSLEPSRCCTPNRATTPIAQEIPAIKTNIQNIKHILQEQRQQIYKETEKESSRRDLELLYLTLYDQVKQTERELAKIRHKNKLLENC